MAKKAWHFLHPGGKLRDGRAAPPDGEWLHQDGAIEPCRNGLHASERVIDALQYHPRLPSSPLCRVELDGTIVPDGEPVDKVAASERRILWRLDGDATDAVLREFARWCALQVIHLWDAPQVVKRWLETGDESLRDAAVDAALSAAVDAALSAAWAATWDAETYAGAAAWDAAGAAARAIARTDAWDSAWDAARTTAVAAQNAELERRFNEAHERSVTA